jgi:hypothetical protein
MQYFSFYYSLIYFFDFQNKYVENEVVYLYKETHNTINSNIR